MKYQAACWPWKYGQGHKSYQYFVLCQTYEPQLKKPYFLRLQPSKAKACLLSKWG